MIKLHKLIDIWKHINKDKCQYTWRRKNSVEKSRIDFWLTDKTLTPLIFHTDIRPALIQYTDHMAISLKLAIPNERGKGFWKLNNDHLNDLDYGNNICNIIRKNDKIKMNSHQTKWEICKLEIRDYSIEYARVKSLQRTNTLQELEDELKMLMSDEKLTDIKTTRINELESQIEAIYNYKAKGAQIRSRVKFLEEGEKNSKYFHNLEKSRQSRKVVTALKQQY